ncbi:hypothetical protein GA707_19010 [Nostocoides sp. F2B08]|uniref:hypothetical protein n=1 Tax=Nostocoides sp. F2B08 TaxID=2653936 RepID=UPI001263C8A8|nr:hypothetical protein [Tetrasphaera sp. F2B08]KAB7740594.1 hypothetical protein GA707_19010 [Tetrasphaera sp. F2B08]
MKLRIRLHNAGACRTTATAFGVLAGLGGITHGVGEVLQGDVRVTGVALDSWTTGPIAEHMGGEPGFTVLPTALSAGLVTLVLATAVVGWSIAGLGRDHGGSALVLLSFGMLLSGGGVGPPVIGILAGAVGRWSADRPPRWLARAGRGTVYGLAQAWLPVFVLSLVNALFLVVGSVVLVYATGLHAPTLFEGSFYLTVVLLLVHLFAAPAHDAARSMAGDAVGLGGSQRETDVRARASRPAVPVAGLRTEE